MNHKFSKGMVIWKGNGSTTTFLKGLEILLQERRGEMKTIVTEHFNDILFHKSGLANKQHTNHSHNQSYMLNGSNAHHVLHEHGRCVQNDA